MKRAKSKGIEIHSGITYLGIKGLKVKVADLRNWDWVYERKEEVRGVFNFGCDFKKGVCKQRRGYTVAKERIKACCGGCAGSFGYLKIIAPDTVETYISLFDTKDGFWTPSGCKLPDKLKSMTCISYSCNSNISVAVRAYIDFDEHHYY